MAKVISTIDFTAGTLTIQKGADILSAEQLLFKVTDPTDTTLYINTGFVASDFSAPDIDEQTLDTLVVNLPVDADGVILQGNYTMYYESQVGQKLSAGTILVRYCIEIPTVEIDLEYSCRASTLKSTDITDYDIFCSCSGSDVSPSITRNHVVSYPDTMLTPIADITSTSSVISVAPNIWTGEWVSRVTSGLVYNMPVASYSGDTTYLISGTVSNLKPITVVCEDCLCLLYDCISAVITKYFAIQNTASPKELERYKTTLFDIQTLYMQLRLSEGCETEEDTRVICGKIRIILQAWDCTCDTALSSGYSREIIPVVGNSSTTTSGTNIYNGDGVPAVGLGNNGDYYFNNLNGDVYKKLLGAWVVQFTMGITALVSNHLLDSDNTAVSTHSDVYTELKSIEFDVTDVKDGSVLVLSANLKYLTPTGENTAVRVNAVGTTTDSTSIFIDGESDGISFVTTLEIEFNIAEVAGDLTIVGKTWKLIGEAGILNYGQEVIAIVLNPTLTANSIDILVKSYDNATEVYLNNSRLNHLRTV